jgi:transposase
VIGVRGGGWRWDGKGAVQRELLIGWHEVPNAPGHVFYDRLNGVLDEAGFDREVEALCAASYASGVGRPSVPPGRYFRMLLVGYFEGLESEGGIAWRCADSLSLRQFLKLGTSEAVPDHSTLSRTRARLPLELHDGVFALVLQRPVISRAPEFGRWALDNSAVEFSYGTRTAFARSIGERALRSRSAPQRESSFHEEEHHGEDHLRRASARLTHAGPRGSGRAALAQPG